MKCVVMAQAVETYATCRCGLSQPLHLLLLIHNFIILVPKQQVFASLFLSRGRDERNEKDVSSERDGFPLSL